jgi:copper(I)-binding protein
LRAQGCCAVLLCALLLSGCGSGQSRDGVEVSAAWSRATPPGTRVGVVYFDVVNHAAQPDRLLTARSPAAARVEMHETSMVDGVMRMRPLAGVDLPPGVTLRFAPEGRHMMLVDLAAPLQEGTPISLTLEFARAAPQTLPVPVRALGAVVPPGR